MYGILALAKQSRYPVYLIYGGKGQIRSVENGQKNRKSPLLCALLGKISL